MRVITHPEAEEELEAATLWYEAKQQGLGEEFIAEFEATLRRALAAPERPRILRRNDRKLNFRRFPYAIVYTVKGDSFAIKAVMGLRRRPFYWRTRKFPPHN